MNRKTYDITNVIADLGQDIADFKTTQPLGNRSFVSYTSRSQNAYDIAVTMNAPTKSYHIRFVPTIPGAFHAVTLTTFFRVDNPDVMSNPTMNNPLLNYFIQQVTEIPYNDQLSWVVDITNADYPTTHTFYLKFYLTGTTTGSLFAGVL